MNNGRSGKSETVTDKLAGPRQGEGYILLLCFNLDKFYLSIKYNGLMCNVRV